MRVSVERLRSWILVLAGLLVASILLFFAYARWEVRRITRDLPGKLGISIQQSTNGFTISKSAGGHTIFTLHAAKMVQYKGGGRAQLHDVSITLFAADGSPADYIYGNDFSYDPAGVIRANGEVQIDLQGPAPAAGPQPGSSEGSDGKNVVHVKTSDLIFDQKTGMASTAQRIEFRIAEAAGSANGANFDSRSGVLVMERDVAFDSSVSGRPLSVHASHAEFDRAQQVLHLSKSTANYVSSRGAADQATVYFRSDGSARLIEAQGNVTVGNDLEKIVSGRAHADLDLRSEPTRADLGEGVVYASDNPIRQVSGKSGSGILTFGPEATLRHVQLHHAVSVVEQEKRVAGNSQPGKAPLPQSTTRNVQAEQLDVDFSPGADRKPVAKTILAVGDARFDIRSLFAATPPQETSVAGDRLFVTLKDGNILSSLRATGNTKLVEVNPNGATQSSSGNELTMTFSAATPASKGKSTGGAPVPQSRLVSAEQQGNVMLLQQGKTKDGTPSEETATAQKAVYDALTQVTKLSGDLQGGNPRVKDSSGEVAAEIIELQRLTGDAIATGNVKVTYRESGGQAQPAAFSLGGTDPVHVIADHARFDHAKGMSIFFGEARSDARLWEGSNSISAPVLELSLPRRTLFAHGANGAQGTPVNAVFASAARGAGAKPVQAAQAQARQAPSIVRVSSRTLLYSDAEDKAVFDGDVVAQNFSGLIRSDEMDIYLGMVTATAPSDTARASGDTARVASRAPVSQPKASKQVVRIVALGGIQLEEPGRRATGEKLVYTLQDGNSVLTGSSSVEPKLIDEVHGTVRGASLIFNNRDDSVIVGGGQSRAVTETRVAR